MGAAKWPPQKLLFEHTIAWLSLHRRNRAALFSLIICFLILYSYRQFSPLPSPRFSKDVVCPHSSIEQDVLVVLRTGATEALEKLPVHLETTLRCVPNSVIYSDYEETIDGHHVYDVFDEISEDFKSTVPDFEYYNRIKSKGRKGLIKETHTGSGAAGSLDNPGWKLDKFKFLPMVDKALRHSPNSKWFVFVEPDTYLMWGNMLEYLSKFDSQTPLYIGRPMLIGEVLFAHGGSGFAMSVAAMKKVLEHWKSNRAEYDEYTIKEWAGDMVLGKILADVDIKLKWALPHLQGDPVSTFYQNDSSYNRQAWCYPALTHHHMRPTEIRSLWEFEQEWQRTNDSPLRHGDVFKDYLLPIMTKKREGWDNYCVFNPDYNQEAWSSNGEVVDSPFRKANESFEACRIACESKVDCVQFSYGLSGCLVSNEARLGRKATSQCLKYDKSAHKCEAPKETGQELPEPVSGWMVERLRQYVTAMEDVCKKENAGWVT
jgi:hypothetical protein